MQLRFNFLYNFLVCCLFAGSTSIFPLNAISEEYSNINLKKELNKGNFLIGLKQYLGGSNDSFSKKKKITFSTKNDFLKLLSFNGIEHKSKKINIKFKNIPLKTPYKIERLVFGPFASYESAQKQVKNLKAKGYQNIKYSKNIINRKSSLFFLMNIRNKNLKAQSIFLLMRQ